MCSVAAALACGMFFNDACLVLDVRVVTELVMPLCVVHLARCFDQRLCVYFANALDHTKEAFLSAIRLGYIHDVPDVQCWRSAALNNRAGL